MARKRSKAARDKPSCVACGGSGKNSRGGDCVCVTGPRKRRTEPAEAKPKRKARTRSKRAKKAPEMQVISETLGEPIVEKFLDDEPPKPAPKPKRKRRGKKQATRVYSVEHKRVESRRLVSIETHDPIWQRDESAPPVHAYPENKDAIVRLKPPADATDKLIADIERACRNDGAMAVKVLPRENAAAVVVQGKRRREREEKMTHRQRVAKMVADANSQRHRSLAALCTEVMDEEGL